MCVCVWSVCVCVCACVCVCVRSDFRGGERGCDAVPLGRVRRGGERRGERERAGRVMGDGCSSEALASSLPSLAPTSPNSLRDSLLLLHLPRLSLFLRVSSSCRLSSCPRPGPWWRRAGRPTLRGPAPRSRRLPCLARKTLARTCACGGGRSWRCVVLASPFFLMGACVETCHEGGGEAGQPSPVGRRVTAVSHSACFSFLSFRCCLRDDARQTDAPRVPADTRPPLAWSRPGSLGRDPNSLFCAWVG